MKNIINNEFIFEAVQKSILKILIMKINLTEKYQI